MKMLPNPDPRAVAITITVILVPLVVLAFLLAGPTRTRIRTGHYQVITEISETYSRAISEEAENFTKVFLGDLAGVYSTPELKRMIRPLPTIERFKIYYVRNLKELNQYFDIRRGGPVELEYNDGFYDPNRKIIVLVHSNRDRFNQDLRALRHELTHLLMDQVIYGNGHPDWSRWFAEGIAVYYEKAGDDKRIVEFVKLLIRTGQAVPLDELLGADMADYTGLNNTKYYHQGYILVRFMLEKHTDKFRKFFTEEAKAGRINKDQLYRIFGMAPIEFENAWRDYVIRL